MAAKNNDDVARALAALAGGAVPSEHETPSSGIPSESTVFSPEPAAAAPSAAPLFKPNIVPPASTAAARTAQPARPADKAARPRTASPQPTPPPAAPVLPPMPTIPPPAKIRSSPTSKRPTSPTRPSAPIASAPASPTSANDQESSGSDLVPSGDLLSEIVEDDDDVIAPAPDISAFAAKPKTKPTAKPHLYAQLNFRQTLIPILLTAGVLLISLGSWSAADHEGMLGALGNGIAITLIAVGLVVLAAAVLNMLQVKQILEADRAATV